MEIVTPFHPPAVLSVDGIGFTYKNGREVFRNFSLTVKKREFVALLGPSGCGKSTMLNLLSGFLKPTAGRVCINGQPVFPEMQALGYVFQTPNLFPWLSVEDNVCFGLKMAGKNAVEQREKARHYLSLVGLEAVARDLPHQLSGGMRQRVALARTLALEPDILLMDEPFAALDAITRIQMNEELLRLWSELSQTIIFITHDIDEAVFLADRVVVLGLPPNGIDSEILIDLPRPRDRHKVRSTARFADYGDQLMHRIGAITQLRQSASLNHSGARQNAGP
ncbi:NitT/TauT family transport system ATP-binding protein [Rhizobium pisi]|uniref:ABC transporter ATP-binding protein n=1 Tax=Rhizobium pisi TaxID=574561 RepID=A0A3R9AR41_9HYPH|nr:ABC transporter ATP-binding protein [Rhizobium pisi]MBB3135433.1 NitT/TauT family transport system ATP-binding protein [Rhizobium pisi]RSB81386.1 ABC transporter ATP-binding protein [Rhizobium pisi]TCA44311.1 ABC transporter ATP-binding protein [Rhizobium pisi]